MAKKELYYTIYLAKDDSIVAFGTAKDCATMLGMSMSTFYSTISCVNSGENKRYEYYSEPLDDPEYNFAI